ncbi:MAG: 1-acyl-sn-glycerol-3-phosphate acyltransferase [Treponema sp.]|nr:1-acyl-sn-glycerol-3-phosphate acyltransferase [Treponema sp.]
MNFTFRPVIPLLVIFLAGKTFFLLLMVLVICVSALLVNPRKQYEDESRWYRGLLILATVVTSLFIRIRFHTTGKEKLPEKGPFLIACNHRSKFDPILTWLVLWNRQLVFISKPENFKVPAFGRIIHRLRFVGIDRSSIAASSSAFRRGTELLKTPDTVLAVYPEGSRSLDCQLKPFHAVVFSMAKNSHVPVVAMSIRGTERISSSFPWHSVHIYMDFIECIPEGWIARHGTRELSARVENDIKLSLEQEGNNG